MTSMDVELEFFLGDFNGFEIGTDFLYSEKLENMSENCYKNCILV
jgi:hypothetical protein